jgi:hypothetical protein
MCSLPEVTFSSIVRCKRGKYICMDELDDEEKQEQSTGSRTLYFATHEADPARNPRH